jgi:hypothetical protein
VTLCRTKTPWTLRTCEQSLALLLGEEALERRVVNDNVAHGAQALPARLLLLQQLAAARDVTGVELGEDVLSERLERLTGDDTLASRSLDDNLCGKK